MSGVAPSAVAETMRAIVLTGHGGIDKLVYRDDTPTPRAGVGEVLVRVGACGINNTDINLRVGWYDQAADSELTEDLGLRGREDAREASWEGETVGFPRIQGAAVAGIVAAVGQGVDGTRVGERV